MKITFLKRLVVSLLVTSFLTIFGGPSVLAFNFSFSTDVDTGSESSLTVPLQSELEAASPGNEPALTDETDILEDIGGGTGLRDFGDITDRNVVQRPGLRLITGALVRIINIVEWVLGTLGLLYLIYTAIRLLTATDKATEVYESAKNNIRYILIGFVSVFAIDIFVNNVFFLDDGNFLGSVEEAQRAAQIGSIEVQALYNLAELFLGIISVLVLIYYGVRLTANAGDEDIVNKAKNVIPWAALGLVLVGVAEFVVKDILFVDAGSGISLENARDLFASLTNFASGFIATISIIMAIYAGYLYIISSVDEDRTEQAKKAIVGAVIGIVIAAGAFAISNTFLRFDEGNDLPTGIQSEIDQALSR